MSTLKISRVRFIPASMGCALYDNMGQNNVRFLKLLGKGSYGEVYKAKWNGQLVAAKRIHPLLVELDSPSNKNGVVAKFVQECQLLCRLKHDNIVSLIAIVTDNAKPPILITELLDCDLGSFFKEKNSELLLEELVAIMLGVAKGLEYLHDQDEPIIHRDICPKNILLDRSSPGIIKAKIADVGLAKILGEGSRELSPVPGTQAYMAPETFGTLYVNGVWGKGLSYGTEIDVFSFGMTLLEGIRGYLPCPRENPLAGGRCILDLINLGSLCLSCMSDMILICLQIIQLIPFYIKIYKPFHVIIHYGGLCMTVWKMIQNKDQLQLRL